MRKSRFTEEQISKVLKEHAAGLSAAELASLGRSRVLSGENNRDHAPQRFRRA